VTRPERCRIAGGLLIIVVGVAVGVGGWQLRGGVPPTWPDVVASDATARATARAILFVATLLLLAGVAATFGVGWGRPAGVLAITLFVAGAFWANFVLFGDLRPAHTVPNVLVGGLVAWLLWLGYSAANH